VLFECNVWTWCISGIFVLDNVSEVTSVVSAFTVTLAFYTASSSIQIHRHADILVVFTIKVQSGLVLRRFVLRRFTFTTLVKSD
jgi:hypothetical protein